MILEDVNVIQDYNWMISHCSKRKVVMTSFGDTFVCSSVEFYRYVCMSSVVKNYTSKLKTSLQTGATIFLVLNFEIKILQHYFLFSLQAQKLLE